MSNEQRADKIVYSAGPYLEEISEALKLAFNAIYVVFWGTEGDGHPYNIEVRMATDSFIIGPYQYKSRSEK